MRHHLGCLQAPVSAVPFSSTAQSIAPFHHDSTPRQHQRCLMTRRAAIARTGTVTTRAFSWTRNLQTWRNTECVISTSTTALRQVVTLISWVSKGKRGEHLHRPLMAQEKTGRPVVATTCIIAVQSKPCLRLGIHQIHDQANSIPARCPPLHHLGQEARLLHRRKVGICLLQAARQVTVVVLASECHHARFHHPRKRSSALFHRMQLAGTST